MGVYAAGRLRVMTRNARAPVLETMDELTDRLEALLGREQVLGDEAA